MGNAGKQNKNKNDSYDIGRRKAGKYVAAGLLVALTAAGIGRLFLPDREAKKARNAAIYRGLENEENWARDDVRRKHVENVRRLVSDMEDESDDAEAVRDYRRIIREYFAEIRSRDPKFERENSILYREFIEAGKEAIGGR